jgi:hypothetical protein
MYSLKSNNVYIMSEINNQWILINITDVNNYVYEANLFVGEVLNEWKAFE